MPFIWGINVVDSHYGLIQNNVLFNWAGAGVTLWGSSSYNRFDGNFVIRVSGNGTRTWDALQGDVYWFNNPNNYVTNNIATDINPGGYDMYSYGFSVSAVRVASGWSTGTRQVPAYPGADHSQAGQSVSINMNATPLFDFSGNQIYGATSRGFTTRWLGCQFETPLGNAGTLRNSLVWNQFTNAYFTYKTNNLVIDGFTVRGDASRLQLPYNYTSGIYFGDYMTHNATVKNVDVQNEVWGIRAPQNYGRGGTSDMVTFTI